MKNNVIDMKTREPWRIAQHEPEPEPTDAEKVQRMTELATDKVLWQAQMIRACHGLDAALRMLHRAADYLRTEGKVS